MSSANKNEIAAPAQPPAAERLARRRLCVDPGASLDAAALAALATAAYAPLRAQLAAFLGAEGFDALWRRAVALARREFPAWVQAADATDSPLPPGLSAGLRSADAAEAHRRLIATFVSLIELLFGFIGPDLASQLIAQAWPELPPDAAVPHADGATL